VRSGLANAPAKVLSRWIRAGRSRPFPRWRHGERNLRLWGGIDIPDRCWLAVVVAVTDAILGAATAAVANTVALTQVIRAVQVSAGPSSVRVGCSFHPVCRAQVLVLVLDRVPSANAVEAVGRRTIRSDAAGDVNRD